MIRILHIVGSMNRGGAESRIMDLFRNIDRDRFEFSFLVYDNEICDYHDEITNLGGKFVVLKSLRKSGLLKYLKGISDILKNGNYDVVHVHTGVSGAYWLLIAKKKNVRVRIFHARNTFTKAGNGIISYIYKCFLKRICNKKANIRLAVSPSSAESYFGRKWKQSSHILPNAIEFNKYSGFDAKRVEQYKKEFNIPNNATVFGHVGSFRAEKNHQMIIDVFEQFKNEFENSYLILVGEGKLREKIQKYVKENNVTNVVFAGLREDLENIYPIFDIFLFPSLREGLPGSVIEAQASGISCIISDTIDRIVDLGLGLVYFVGLNLSPEIWAKKCKEVLEEKRCVDSETIKNAFKSKMFTIEVETDEIEEIYSQSQRVVGGKK